MNPIDSRALGLDGGLLPLLGLLLPLLVLALAYLKMVVVLSLLRQALGRAIPAIVVHVLALLLSVLVMAPLAQRCQAAWSSGSGLAEARLSLAAAPLRDYLRRHTPPHELSAVQELAQRVRGPAEASPDPQVNEESRRGAAAVDLSVLLPAFVLSELRSALQIGCLLLLPFLLLDLLCAALLTGLALPGLSPAAVALPFKILVFVLCDGWSLLARALALGYPP